MRSSHWRDGACDTGAEPAAYAGTNTILCRAQAVERRPTENGWYFKKALHMSGCVVEGEGSSNTKQQRTLLRGEWKKHSSGITLDDLQTLLDLFSQQTSMVDINMTWESQLAGEHVLGYGGRISAVWGWEWGWQEASKTLVLK